MLRRRKRNRLNGFDYSLDRLYFVTSCVKDMRCVFGHVCDQKMILNACGQNADRQWRWLEEQYPYVCLHQHVIMPNHMHGIIEISRGLICDRDDDFFHVGTGRDPSLHEKIIKSNLFPN